MAPWTRRRFLASAAGLLGAGCGRVAVSGGSSPPVWPFPRGRLLPAPTSVPADAAEVALAFPPRFTLDPYRGLGCWVDVFDWSSAYSKGAPTVRPEHMAALAARGVRTVFLQSARYDRPDPADDLLERDRLFALVDAAHAASMSVVAWYLPTHVDESLDLRRSWAVFAAGRFDGFALDIESQLVPDPVARNRRLAELLVQVRIVAGHNVIGAIVFPPTMMQDVNPGYWPGFDWPMVAERCDVFLPMNYWTSTYLTNSPWRDAGASTVENIRRLRAAAGRSDYPVHMVGGLAGLMSVDAAGAMVDAVQAEGAIGASIYDLASTPEALWPVLGRLRGS